MNRDSETLKVMWCYMTTLFTLHTSLRVETSKCFRDRGMCGFYVVKKVPGVEGSKVEKGGVT